MPCLFTAEMLVGVDVEISVEPGREAPRCGNVCYGLLICEERDEYLEYKRSVNFDGIFRLFTMVDADLGGDHTSGKNGNSVMAAVTFLNESHCYSYSKSIKAVCLATYQSEYYALTKEAR